MILADSKIKEYQKKGILHIEDFNEKQLNPNSYNLRLMNKLLVYDEVVLDMRKENKTREIIIPEEGYLLEPGRLYIGSTVEYTETHAPLLAKVDGRSSIGRLGIFVHYTAGFIDTGFCGNITLEIGCTQPVRIYPNVEICQIEYELVEGVVEKPYCGKYQGQTLPTASRMNMDLENDDIKPSFATRALQNLEIGKYPRAVPTTFKASNPKSVIEYCKTISDIAGIAPKELADAFNKELLKKLVTTGRIDREYLDSYKNYFRDLIISELHDIIEKTLRSKMWNKESLITERIIHIMSDIVDKKYNDIYKSIIFKNNLGVEFILNMNFYIEIHRIILEFGESTTKYVHFKNSLTSLMFDGDFHIKIVTETLNGIIVRKDEE